MADKPRATLADYVVIALSPALIMGLVGSLVFFLLEVFYRGQYGSNLRWVLFFYVFGAVLAARMTVSGEGGGRGPVYSIILGLLTWVGTLRFAEFPPESTMAPYSGLINFFLVALIWWCSNRLVWDCTHIDDSMDVDARGLLEASGLEEHEQQRVPPVGAAATGKNKKKSWLQRWFDHAEESKKKRTPGVWVVYFSLAALPLFGLGQAFIPPDAGERRAYTFWLLVLYLACGLGLLLTTCFLGLRRYLRQRKLKMPPAMTGAWLVVGGVMIVALLGVTAFIPRPEAGYSALASNDRPEDDDREASNQAVVKDSKGKDDRRPTGKQDKDGQPGDKRDKDAPGKDKDRGKDKGDQKDKGGDKDKKDSGGGQKDKQDKGEKNEKGDKTEKGESGSRSSVPQMHGLTNFLQNLGPWVKWLVFAILAVVVLFWLLRNGLRYLANFTDWARQLLDWWNRLWAGLFGGGSGGGDEGESDAVPADRPYRSYPDPFLTGAADGMDVRELVKYTFAALQAWGREQGQARKPDETPLEYAGRLAAEHEDVAEVIRKLASLYARTAYGYGSLPEATEDFLREFWHALDAATSGVR